MVNIIDIFEVLIIMKIEYKNKKLKDVCNTFKNANKKYGLKVAKKMQLRLMQIQAFENLNQIPITPPFRRHKLVGDRSGYFAIDITKTYRFIIKPSNGDINNLNTITIICIEEVSNHYDD